MSPEFIAILAVGATIGGLVLLQTNRLDKRLSKIEQALGRIEQDLASLNAMLMGTRLVTSCSEARVAPAGDETHRQVTPSGIPSRKSRPGVRRHG